MSCWSLLPSSLKRQICLYLTDVELLCLDEPFLKDGDDIFWRQRTPLNSKEVYYYIKKLLKKCTISEAMIYGVEDAYMATRVWTCNTAFEITSSFRYNSKNANIRDEYGVPILSYMVVHGRVEILKTKFSIQLNKS